MNLEREKRRLPKAARIGLAVTAIAGITAGGYYDYKEYTQPAILANNEFISQNYPILTRVEEKDLKTKIERFNKESESLIKQNREAEIPELVRNNQITQAYNSLDESERNILEIQKQSQFPFFRYLGDMLAMIGPTLGAGFYLAADRVMKTNQKNRKEVSPGSLGKQF